MLSGPLDERLSSKIDLKTWHFTLVLAWVKFKCHVNSWNPTIWLYLVMWTSINLACCLAGHLVRPCVWCSKRYFTKRLVSLRPPQDEWGRRGPRRPVDACLSFLCGDIFTHGRHSVHFLIHFVLSSTESLHAVWKNNLPIFEDENSFGPQFSSIKSKINE